MACEYSQRTSGRRVSLPDLAQATICSMDVYMGQTTSLTGAAASKSCMNGPSYWMGLVRS